MADKAPCARSQARPRGFADSHGHGKVSGAVAEPADNEDPVTEGDAAHTGLLRQMRLMLRAIRVSTAGRALVWLCVGTLLVVIATAYGQIRLNQWNKPFYDALSRRDLADFFFQLGVFFVIAGCLLVLNVVQRWLVEMLKLKLREGLFQDLLDDWMKPRRAFWLANAGQIGVNPDQRMHEDARKLCELSADLAVGLLQASILFGSFAGILWVLSTDFSFHVGEVDYDIPGFMLWAAILYAGFGSVMSYWVGGDLIGRNADRYAREADLRFSLVRVNEHVDGISLAEGEADEKRRIELHFGNVLAAMRRLVNGLTNLTWVTAGFGWITLVAPILVAAPLYFTGKISFGGLMMAAGAFTQAQSSLRWFVDNFSVIADWRATLLRVAAFRQALSETHEPVHADSRISYAEGEPGELRIESLAVFSSAGAERLKEPDVTVRAGDRVLIVGAPGTGRAQLFRALAGLWTWGAGRITRPRGEQIFYVPRGSPYLPRGSLREVLAYPASPAGLADDDLRRALYRIGLERLAPLLGETRRWDHELSQDEQVCLSFARMLVQNPRWVLIDGSFGSLDDDVAERVLDIFANDLKGACLIHIGGASEAHDPLYRQVMHLVKGTMPARNVAMAETREP